MQYLYRVAAFYFIISSVIIESIDGYIFYIQNPGKSICPQLRLISHSVLGQLVLQSYTHIPGHVTEDFNSF